MLHQRLSFGTRKHHCHQVPKLLLNQAQAAAWWRPISGVVAHLVSAVIALHRLSVECLLETERHLRKLLQGWHRRKQNLETHGMYGLFLRKQRMVDIVHSASESLPYYLIPKVLDAHATSRSHEHSINEEHTVYAFSLETGTSTLRHHLFSHHLALWVEACDRFKIPITASSALPHVRAYRQSAGMAPPPSERPENVPKFSNKAFIDAIVEFIIADDQVCVCYDLTINILSY